MKRAKMRLHIAVLLGALGLLAMLSPQAGTLSNLPDALVLRTGGETSVAVSLPMSVEAIGGVVTASGEEAQVRLTAGEETGSGEVVFRLLGILPVKRVQVTVEQPRVLVPGGRSLGVAVETKGVVVVGSSDVGDAASPAYAAGIRSGDIIQTVNGAAVDDAQTLSEKLDGGTSAQICVLRGEKTLNFDVLPEVDPRDGALRLGVWVRESTAGVGTLTYYDPQMQRFGALGHAITDADAGVIFPVGEGAVYENEVVRVTRGKKGEPGELTGAFFEETSELGSIERNTEFGVFGSASEQMMDGSLYPDGLPVGTQDEIHTGGAQLLSTVDGDEVRAYDCEIEKIHHSSSPESRSMVIRITDPELLEKTGGIVQGMSGSPIIQDGKIVGAVTHVLIDDPTRGYGIFIENMLDAAG